MRPAAAIALGASAARSLAQCQARVLAERERAFEAWLRGPSRASGVF